MVLTPWSEIDSIERYRGYLLMLARLNQRPVLRGKVDPSDVVQTTLLYAYEKRAQFRGETESEYLAWLRSILANHLAETVRRFSRQRRDASLEKSIHSAFGDSELRVCHWLAATYPSPSQQAARRDELLRLANALGDLPDDQRRAIELHHLQGFSLAETGGRWHDPERRWRGFFFAHSRS